MEEDFIYAINLVSNKYSDDYEYYPLLVLGLYTIIHKYNDYKDLISNIFNNTNIYIEKDTVDNIIKKHELNDDNKNNMYYDIYGVSYQGNYFYLNDNNKIVILNDNPILICDSKNSNSYELLNVFIHEFNHLLKGSINGYETYEENNCCGYVIRNGINYYHYKYYDITDTLYEENYYDTLDEVINTIQTTEMMESLLELNDIIPDGIIKKYYDTLDKDSLSFDVGYEEAVFILRPLWENNVFRYNIENNLVNGNIDSIIDYFDNLMGEGWLLSLSDTLDEYDDLCSSNNYDKIITLKIIIEKYIDEFNNKTICSFQK